MNNRTVAILAMLALVAAAVAPVIANDRRARAAAGQCGTLMKFDKKSKSCHSRI